MKTIKNDIKDELIINKSKFITILKRIDDVNKISDAIINIKEEHEGATHYCYAFIIGEYKKCSDDGEPSKTAGMPILNVLEKENLSNVLCLVIRYYGGIKLGTGGLVRAYTNSVTNALEKAKIDNLVNGLELTLTFNYDNTKTIDYILKNAFIKEKEYNEEVTYKVDITFEEYDLIKEQLEMFANTIYKKENVFI